MANFLVWSALDSQIFVDLCEIWVFFAIGRRLYGLNISLFVLIQGKLVVGISALYRNVSFLKVLGVLRP